MIIALISLVIGFIGGFWAGFKNANSEKVQKAKSLLDEISGK
jgi:uncharacterized protein YneF (UPF0154 family)